LKSSWTGSLTGLESDVSIGFGHGLGISHFSERLGTLVETMPRVVDTETALHK